MVRPVNMQYGRPLSAVNQQPMEDWELIWENENPTASFAEQIISLNLARFGWIKVEARYSSSIDGRIAVDVPVENDAEENIGGLLQFTSLALASSAAGNIYSYSRFARATPTGISITGCSRRRLNTTDSSANSTQNGILVPQRIWGKTTASTVGGDASFHDSGAGMRLLWTNHDTESAFAAQTIALDLSEYDAVFIPYVYTNGAIYASVIIPKGMQMYVRYPSNSGSNIQFSSRVTTVSGTGVTFADCGVRTQGSAGTSTVTNTRLLPSHIYGIKFG